MSNFDTASEVLGSTVCEHNEYLKGCDVYVLIMEWDNSIQVEWTAPL